MKEAARENLKTGVTLGTSILMFLGLMFLIDWLFHGRSNWIDYGVATLLVFGGLGYRFRRDLKQPKCLAVFVGLNVVHWGVFVRLFHSGIQIRMAWYVAIVFVESFLVGVILTGVSGAHNEEEDRG
jgi:hypothetical protein